MSRWSESNETLNRIKAILPYRGRVLKLRDIVQENALCEAFGFDPWCINEGTGDANEKIYVDEKLEIELAHYNNSKDVKWKFCFNVPEDTDLVLKFESFGDTFTHSVGVYRDGEFYTSDNLSVIAYRPPILYCELMRNRADF